MSNETAAARAAANRFARAEPGDQKDRTMSDHNVYNYEAMIVFPQSQTSDLAGAVRHIEEIISRAEGEIIALSKWGERNLATPIEKNKRGLFLLTYFRVRGPRLANIERDCNLSELIARFLIIRADHLTLEEMRATDGRETLAAEARLRAEGRVPEAREETPEPIGAGAGQGPEASEE